jgi:hypothetical protein
VAQRSADIPGRPLHGGQAADDRSDRAILTDSLACFHEVSGIVRELSIAGLWLGRWRQFLLGRRCAGWVQPMGGDGQAYALAPFPDSLFDLAGAGVLWRLVTGGNSGQISARLHVERQAFGPGHLVGRRDGQRPRSLVAVHRGICRVIGDRARQSWLRVPWRRRIWVGRQG